MMQLRRRGQENGTKGVIANAALSACREGLTDTRILSFNKQNIQSPAYGATTEAMWEDDWDLSREEEVYESCEDGTS